MQGIRVLFIAPHLDGGGTERVLVNLINNFDPDVVTAELLIYKRGGSLENNLKKGIKINYLCSRPRYSLPELTAFLRQNNFDLLFPTKHYLLLLVFLALYLLRRKIPVVYREITHVSTELKLNFADIGLENLYNNSFVYRKLYSKVNAVIVPSREMREDLNINFQVPFEKIRVIANPVDISHILSSSREEITDPWFSEDIPMVISAGRLVKQKNYTCLLHAFRLVADWDPRVRLTILGKGGLKKELDRLINKLGLEERAKIYPHTPNPFLYLKNSDIFVLSSLWEGYPNVLLEAFACGVPVISADCPSGPSEIIDDGINGFLVKSNNPAALACAIKKMLADENKRAAFARAGWEKVRAKHDLQVIIPQYTEFFRNILTKEA